MNSVESSIRNSYKLQTDLDTLTTILIQKEMEKWLISNIYAPIKLSKREKIKKSFKKTVTQIGDDAHSAMTTMTGQLDESLKGDFPTKVQSVMEEEASKYDNF